MPEDENLSFPLPEVVEETDEEFKPTGIEHTPEEEKGQRAKIDPYDPELIRVDPKTFSLRQVLDMIDDTDLELAPDFQRLKVWNLKQKSRLIESVLLRIPLPAFYFSSDVQGGLQVVDGLQRLSTIHDFVRGGASKDASFALQDLEYLGELEGKSFSDIKNALWTRRINTTQIIANVIDPKTPYRVKFDIFRRINTGGSPLNSQEIRHCLSTLQARETLKTMTSLTSFSTATGGVFKNNYRMVDKEVALRYIAFKRFPGLQEYSRFATMDEFLNNANQLLGSQSGEVLDDVLSSFDRSMANNALVFGAHAFRKWPEGDGKLRPFNRALFDCWSVLLSDYIGDQLRPKKDKIVEKSRKLMTENSSFLAAISSGTGDIRKISYRFEATQRILAESLA
jgi:hypothetical protein